MYMSAVRSRVRLLKNRQWFRQTLRKCMGTNLPTSLLLIDIPTTVVSMTELI